jgi:hypothetical protein
VGQSRTDPLTVALVCSKTRLPDERATLGWIVVDPRGRPSEIGGTTLLWPAVLTIALR